MYHCPKCQYLRTTAHAHVHEAICPACGIAYEKWLAQQKTPEANASTTEEEDAVNYTLEYEDEQLGFREWISYVPSNIDPGVFWARGVLWFGFVVWGFYFITAGIDWEKIGSSFLHNVNLPFHEFGHVLLSPFGDFMRILGGSLFQVMMPLGLMGVFLLQQRDTFAASVMLWWSGQNFIDIAPYIDDAQDRGLPLVGGGGEESHDWGNLLTMLDALPHTHAVAQTSFTIGVILIILALNWGFYVLLLQKKQLREH